MGDVRELKYSAAIERLIAHCHRKTYPAKSVIISAGDPSTEFYYILDGSVSVMINDDSGHEIVLTYLNTGDFFGEIGLFDESQPRSAGVRARTRCEIACISYEKMRGLTDILPDLVFAIASQLSLRLKNTTRKVGDLAFTDVAGRVARALLGLCKEPDAMTHPDGMQVRITRQELGRIVGCSREMVGRVLKTLEDQELIKVKGKTMVVIGEREQLCH